MIHTLLHALGRRRSAVVVPLLGLSLMACGPDPFAPVARSENIDADVQVWALTGSPINYPTALLVAQRFAVRPDPSGSFDIGFDINPAGELVVLPVSRMISPLGGTRAVGFIVPTAAYADITEAPRDGWAVDSTIALNQGDVFLVRVVTQFCAFESSQDIYAKYRVDSILPAERRIRLTGRINPNCGFRSFADGIPEF